jgi:small subunit ribosomal protein S16
MSVRIRLRRMGRKKQAHYRIVVADSAAPRDGRFVETLGYYKPLTSPARIVVDLEKADEWIGKGAEQSDTVRTLLNKARKGGDDKVAVGEIDPEEAKALKAVALGARRGAEAKAREVAVAAAVAQEVASAAAAAVEAEEAVEAEASEEEPAADAEAEPKPEVAVEEPAAELETEPEVAVEEPAAELEAEPEAEAAEEEAAEEKKPAAKKASVAKPKEKKSK